MAQEKTSQQQQKPDNRHKKKDNEHVTNTYRFVLQRRNVSTDPAVVSGPPPAHAEQPLRLSGHAPVGAGVRRPRDSENGRCLRLDVPGGEPGRRLVRPRLVGGGVVSAEEEIRPASRGRGVAVGVVALGVAAADVLVTRLLAAGLVARGGRRSPARLAV